MRFLLGYCRNLHVFEVRTLSTCLKDDKFESVMGECTCEVEVTGVPSLFSVISKAAVFAIISPTFVLICEKNAAAKVERTTPTIVTRVFP